MVNIDNNSYSKTSSNIINNGVIKTYNAFALIGFIRFLEGYYMTFVTKQLAVGVIGYHIIYTIEDLKWHFVPI